MTLGTHTSRIWKRAYFSSRAAMSCSVPGPDSGLPGRSGDLALNIQGVDQSLMMVIDENGAITVHYFNGILKEPDSASWGAAITPDMLAGIPDTAWLTFTGYGANKIGWNATISQGMVPGNQEGPFYLDYIGLFTDTSQIPVELSEFTLE
jgi:hypothetical protein